MTDNEKLIEEARDALAEVGDAAVRVYQATGVPLAETRVERSLRLLLAVFEKALTPTNDEREALRVEAEKVQRAAWAEIHGQDPTRTYSVAEVKQLVYSFDNVLSSALRRSGEPRAEDRTPRDFQAYELTVDMLEDLLVTAGVAVSEHGVAIRKTAGALVYKIGRRLAPEPQSEPSFEAPEPSADHEYRGNRSQDTCWVEVDGKMCRKPVEAHTQPQAEPSDAQVEAAAHEYHERGNGEGSFDRMAAHVRTSLLFRMGCALRAAAKTGGER